VDDNFTILLDRLAIYLDAQVAATDARKMSSVLPL